MTLKEKINKADEYTGKLKKDLEALVAEYNKEKETLDGSGLLDLKDRFIAIEYQLGNLTVRSRELHGIAEIESKTAYNLAYTDEKQNFDGGKAPSNEVCGIKARLKTAEESLMEVQADNIRRLFEHFQSTANNYITQLSQRVKNVQQEVINSRQGS